MFRYCEIQRVVFIPILIVCMVALALGNGKGKGKGRGKGKCMKTLGTGICSEL